MVQWTQQTEYVYIYVQYDTQRKTPFPMNGGIECSFDMAQLLYAQKDQSQTL